MMKRIVMMALAAGLFVCVGNVQAQCTKGAKAACCAKKQEKATISELKTVNKDEVAKLVHTSNVTIFDARDAESYAQGHIDGAVNFSQAALPSDKNATLVFYCGGVKCPLAAKAAKQAQKLGYKNVMVYHGGWAEWSQNRS
jgi:rhodanese-related sulfurtransferase